VMLDKMELWLHGGDIHSAMITLKSLLETNPAFNGLTVVNDTSKKDPSHRDVEIWRPISPQHGST
jgi:hypothetical protein